MAMSMQRACHLAVSRSALVRVAPDPSIVEVSPDPRALFLVPSKAIVIQINKESTSKARMHNDAGLKNG
jgi:hypothetical protein